MVRENSDAIMEELQVEGFKEFNENKVPLLGNVEVKTIIDEGLEDFFAEELQRVVRDSSLLYVYILNI